MGGAYSMHGGDEKCIGKFKSQILKGRDYLGDLGVDERIILK
jgi:hypothetical protein